MLAVQIRMFCAGSCLSPRFPWRAPAAGWACGLSKTGLPGRLVAVGAGTLSPASGAGGLYQFLPSTWQSLGYSGLPQDAPVSVQNAAFQQAYAQSGTGPWAPSDGC